MPPYYTPQKLQKLLTYKTETNYQKFREEYSNYEAHNVLQQDTYNGEVVYWISYTDTSEHTKDYWVCLSNSITIKGKAYVTERIIHESHRRKTLFLKDEELRDPQILTEAVLKDLLDILDSLCDYSLLDEMVYSDIFHEATMEWLESGVTANIEIAFTESIEKLLKIDSEELDIPHDFIVGNFYNLQSDRDWLRVSSQQDGSFYMEYSPSEIGEMLVEEFIEELNTPTGELLPVCEQTLEYWLCPHGYMSQRTRSAVKEQLEQYSKIPNTSEVTAEIRAPMSSTVTIRDSIGNPPALCGLFSAGLTLLYPNTTSSFTLYLDIDTKINLIDDSIHLQLEGFRLETLNFELNKPGSIVESLPEVMFQVQQWLEAKQL